VKHSNERNTGYNKEGPHDKRAEDTPEKDFILQLRSNAKIRKNHQKDEKVVYAQGFFYKISGQKLQRDLRPPPEINCYIKDECNHNPDGTQEKGFLQVYNTIATVQHSKI
jgi:hypothetical protein